ncbi:MAG: class II fumarate hydratase [Ruminococcaceae bacterium]|nr:class II fumarate hydratase [Oscillospiraceae bacterium]
MQPKKTDYRIEKDSMGEVCVPADKYFGAQTQRSLDNFKIGEEKMPRELIDALAIIKLCAAKANFEILPEKMTEQKLSAIEQACDEIISGELDGNFPLSVWQTGSGTQTNMNVNEVISNRANEILGKKLIHPNDDVNMSQSSNDVFPSAMHVSAYLAIQVRLIPAIDRLVGAFKKIEAENFDVIKSGRTHLQDATPIRFSQEVSGWRGMLEASKEQITLSLGTLKKLAIGGTAVGTGINAPADFGHVAAQKISEMTGGKFVSEGNKFHALTSKDALVFAHGAIKGLAANLLKIANDVRLLASGPRCGLGEINIPANEPGSSIMPGKVNPTQCEAMTMVCVQVIGNDTSIGVAASQGNFQLNVFMPMMIYNFLQSVRLMSDAMESFHENCILGLSVNRGKMRENLEKSLMTVTALNPYIGYENAAKVAKLAHSEGITLRDAVVKLNFLSAEKFDEIFDFNKMV